ncbi:MAG TPA: hypothetical protein VFY13_00720 [Luteolibacter sp.]|nr:hypothetical protein [Luteolibacter sp.]
MKKHPWAASTAATIMFGAIAIPVALAQNNNRAAAIPSEPAGIMVCNPTVVQTGTHPTINWSILYPSKVSDVATITPPGTITLTTPMYVSVRPSGLGVTGAESGADMDTIHAETRLSVNGGSFVQLFYGVHSDVDPAYSLYIKKLQPGSTIDFGGRFVENGAWSPFYTTRSGNFQAIALVDGDSIPTNFDLRQSGKLAGYLKPYVDGTGKVKVGPLSVLVLMEMAETDHANASFDYQDAALLVNFASRHPNNGHGNNLDGVDSSNPGRGSGGPNGAVDPSAGVDDERR